MNSLTTYPKRHYTQRNTNALRAERVMDAAQSWHARPQLRSDLAAHFARAESIAKAEQEKFADHPLARIIDKVDAAIEFATAWQRVPDYMDCDREAAILALSENRAAVINSATYNNAVAGILCTIINARPGQETYPMPDTAAHIAAGLKPLVALNDAGRRAIQAMAPTKFLQAAE